MEFVNGVVLLAIILFGLSVFLAYKKVMGFAVASFLCATFFVVVLVYLGAPRELGYGVIPNEAKAYSNRLQTGAIYETVASLKDNYGLVVVVRKEDESRLFAIRVEGPVPPEHFTLINGKPIAIKY